MSAGPHPISVFFRGIFLGVFFGFGLAAAPLARAGGLTTLAVWDFDNASFIENSSVAFMRRALPEMLLSDLAQTGTVRLVERVNLLDALEEQKLSSGGLVEEETRLRLGRIVGASQMVFGSYMALGDQIRVDVRLVDVETSLTLATDSYTTPLQEVATSMRNISRTIAARTGAVTQNQEKESQKPASLDVWKEYEMGIALMDQRAFDEAVAKFHSILARYPGFAPAEKQLGVALERLSRQ
jgi:TolB-like protein